MADKYLGNKQHFNKSPIMWSGMEVYPGNGASSNLYGTLNVIKNPEEPTTPDINTDGNVNVKKNVIKMLRDLLMLIEMLMRMEMFIQKWKT
jgi:hypothetical protein